MCSSFILLTWPYHFSPFSVIFLDACTTLVVVIRLRLYLIHATDKFLTDTLTAILIDDLLVASGAYVWNWQTL